MDPRSSRNPQDSCIFRSCGTFFTGITIPVPPELFWSPLSNSVCMGTRTYYCSKYATINQGDYASCDPRDKTTTTMATGDYNNNVDGDGTTGNEVEDDGDGTKGDDNNDNNDGDDDDNGDGDSGMGSGATEYDDGDDGDGR